MIGFELTAADTVVIFPPEKETAEGGSAHGETSEILEKPLNRAEQVSLSPSEKLTAVPHS